MNKPRIIVGNSDLIAENTEKSFVVMSISRTEIESCDYSDALNRLHTLTDTQKNVLLYKESIALHVGGYDDDKRELAEIPEVRAYFKALVNEWPHWIWFLPRQMGFISLLMSILCKVEIKPSGKNVCIVDFINDHEVVSVLEDMLNRSLYMLRLNDIPDSIMESSIHSALAELQINGVDLQKRS